MKTSVIYGTDSKNASGRRSTTCAVVGRPDMKRWLLVKSIKHPLSHLLFQEAANLRPSICREKAEKVWDLRKFILDNMSNRINYFSQQLYLWKTHVNLSKYISSWLSDHWETINWIRFHRYINLETLSCLCVFPSASCSFLQHGVRMCCTTVLLDLFALRFHCLYRICPDSLGSRCLPESFLYAIATFDWRRMCEGKRPTNQRIN